ncbi:MAG TPA: hypothetical protein VFJ12_13340 [Segeticoccus sp.]|nr:hypothetical protein [Segeticoccus sp.]
MAVTTTGGSGLGFAESVLERELDRLLRDELDRLLPGEVLEPALDGRVLDGRALDGRVLDGPERDEVAPGEREHAAGSAPSVELPDSSMPEPVRVALRALLVAAEPGAVDGLDGDGALQLVEAAGVLRGWADSVMVDGARVLFEQLRTLTGGGPAGEADLPRSRRERALAEARSLTVDEVEAATGAGRTQCQKVVGFATAGRERTAAAREAMREGRCEFYRAQVVEHATTDLDPDLADEVAVHVLGCRPDGTPWSHRQFRGRLRRRVLKHQDREQREKTHEKAVADRGAWTELADDGTGELSLTGDAPRVVAARERIEAVARAVRAQGDERTLDQLRSDVALDLLTHGVVPPVAAGADGVGGPAHVSDSTSADGGAVGDPLAVYRAIGELPPAQVSLTVPLDTLLGLRDGLGELAGYGPVDAQQARRIAFAPGSVWWRVVTDPVTGWAVERSVNAYRPDPRMADQVRTRDGTTREPGSTTPAGRPTVDLDHRVPYASDGEGRSVGGPTSAANLYALTRRAHNRKTRGYWSYEVNAHGVCTWTTATGRTYTTAPCDYEELAGAGPTGCEAEHHAQQDTDRDRAPRAPRPAGDDGDDGDPPF